MMYQFQRSFIKAASESVDVYGPIPEEEPHFPGAAIPPALLPPPVLPGCVLASRAGLELGQAAVGGDQRRRRREHRAGCDCHCDHQLLLNCSTVFGGAQMSGECFL